MDTQRIREFRNHLERTQPSEAEVMKGTGRGRSLKGRMMEYLHRGDSSNLVRTLYTDLELYCYVKEKLNCLPKPT